MPQRLVIARGDFEDHFARFTISRLNGIHDAGARLRGYRKAVHQNINRPIEVDLEKRFRRRELEDLTGLIEAVKASLAQIEQPGLNSFREFMRLHAGRLSL